MASRTRMRCTRSATPITSKCEFEEPRLPGRVRPTLFIGPPRQRGGPLLEVMVEVSPPRDLHTFHVMIARQKHLDRIGRTK